MLTRLKSALEQVEHRLPAGWGVSWGEVAVIATFLLWASGTFFFLRVYSVGDGHVAASTLILAVPVAAAVVVVLTGLRPGSVLGGSLWAEAAVVAATTIAALSPGILAAALDRDLWLLRPLELRTPAGLGLILLCASAVTLIIRAGLAVAWWASGHDVDEPSPQPHRLAVFGRHLGSAVTIVLVVVVAVALGAQWLGVSERATVGPRLAVSAPATELDVARPQAVPAGVTVLAGTEAGLLVARENGVAMVDPFTLSERWHRQVPGASVSNVSTAAAGRVATFSLFGRQSGTYGISAATGKRLWHVWGRWFEYGYDRTRNEVYRNDAATGRQQWRVGFADLGCRAGARDEELRPRSGAVVFDCQVGPDVERRDLIALSARDGKELWRQPVTPGGFSVGTTAVTIIGAAPDGAPVPLQVLPLPSGAPVVRSQTTGVTSYLPDGNRAAGLGVLYNAQGARLWQNREWAAEDWSTALVTEGYYLVLAHDWHGNKALVAIEKSSGEVTTVAGGDGPVLASLVEPDPNAQMFSWGTYFGATVPGVVIPARGNEPVG